MDPTRIINGGLQAASEGVETNVTLEVTLKLQFDVQIAPGELLQGQELITEIIEGADDRLHGLYNHSVLNAMREVITSIEVIDSYIENLGEPAVPFNVLGHFTLPG